MTGSNCRHPACKAGALPAELIVHVVTRPGIEPGIPPWKGGVLTAWPTGHDMKLAPRVGLEPTTDRLTADCSTDWAIEECMERETRFELATPALARRCSTAELFPHVHGASGQNRTVDTRIFSPLLYQLSYRGMIFCKKKWRPRSDLNWRSSPWQGDMLTATPRGRIQSTCLVYRLSEFLSTLYYNIFDEFFFIF